MLVEREKKAGKKECGSATICEVRLLELTGDIILQSISCYMPSPLRLLNQYRREK